MIIHQSDLTSWSRCAAQFGYRRAGWREDTNSALAYGTVVHHALLVLESLRADGKPFDECVKVAIETFKHYWHPANIESLTEPVPGDGWLPQQSYGILLERGCESIRQYADLIRFDDQEMLGLEYSFQVPIAGTWDDDLGEPHILAGSIDRLAVRHYRRVETVCVDDYKTGKDYKALRYNLQFTAYCYATTLPEFWLGWRGEDGFGQERGTQLYERFLDAPRRGTWINMRKFKFQDAGFRGVTDYERLRLAIEQIALAIKADIFPLSISGENCKYCPFRNGCGGTGLPDDNHGNPMALAASHG